MKYVKIHAFYIADKICIMPKFIMTKSGPKKNNKEQEVILFSHLRCHAQGMTDCL